MEIWMALVVGFLGSLHCIGMCGPIAISLPLRSKGVMGNLLNQTFYHTGRIVSYSILGSIVGSIGWSINIAGFQRWMSIFVGVSMLIALAITYHQGLKKLIFCKVYRLISMIKKLWPDLQKSDHWRTLFITGILNGFLPCGFVYVAMAGAITTGNIAGAAAYMALFGIGTIPAMAGVAHFGVFLQAGARKKLGKLLPAGVVAIALLLILRGLSLGIPYISPDLDKAKPGHCTCKTEKNT